MCSDGLQDIYYNKWTMVSGPLVTTQRVVDSAARLQVQKIAEYRNTKSRQIELLQPTR